MAAIKGEDVKKILEEIENLCKSVKTKGDPGRAMLSLIEPGLNNIQKELPTDEEKKFKPEEWDKLPDDKKASLHEQLLKIKAALTMAADSDEPKDPKSIMFKVHASNIWVVVLTVIAIVGTLSILWLIYCRWPAATEGTPIPTPVLKSAVPEATASETTAPGTPAPEITILGTPAPKTTAIGTSAPNVTPLGKTEPKGQTRCKDGICPPTEANVLLMIILMGALGGFIHFASSLAQFVGNRKLFRSWIIYYLLMPFEGSSLALIIYLLLRVGVLAPSTSSNGSTENLNLIGLYAFAGLTGLFAKQAIEMLADVFNVIFKKVQAKDPIEKGEDAGKSDDKVK
jgi:hypothetical protein